MTFLNEGIFITQTSKMMFFIKTLEMLSMMKYDEFNDEFNEYFGYSK